jgi:CHAT domain-containing protein
MTVSKFIYFYCGVVASCLLSFSLFIPKVTVAEEVSSTQSQGSILLNRAEKAYLAGNYQLAIASWLKIIKEQEPKSHQSVTAYSNLASLYWHIGNPSVAIKYWQESLAFYREQETESAQAKLAATLVDTARAYNDLGQPRFSIPLLTEAVAIAQQQQLVKVQDVAYLVLGNAYTIEKNYDSAIDVYQKSLNNIAHANSDLSVVVGNNLSRAYQQKALITRVKAIAKDQEGELSARELWRQVKRDRALAWQAAKKATEIRKSSRSIARVEALLQLASLAKNDVEKNSIAVESLLKAEFILSALPDSQQKVYSLIKLGRLTKDYDSRAESILKSAVKTAQKINHPRVASFAFGAIGKHYESQHQYDRALSWTKQAQFSAQQAQAPDSLYQWDWQVARIYQAMGDTETSIEAYQRAIASLQSIRNKSFQPQGNHLSNFQSDIEPIYRSLIELLLLNNSSRSSLKQALQTKDLLLLSELENFFQDDCFELETYNEQDKSAYLKQTDTAIINTIILDDKTYLIWQFPDGKLKKYAVDISQNQLKKLVTQWRFDLENKENDNYLPLSQQLYKLFFPPAVQADLATSKPKNLIFVNDGILRNVPLVSLHDGQKFLVENYSVTTSLGFNIQAKQTNLTVEKAIAFGLSTQTAQFPPLPYVEQEIQQLGKLVQQDQFLNNQFSLKNFVQQVESNETSLVHIATHGQFGGTTENTFLQAYQSQISLKELEETLKVRNNNFPQHPLELLVLSACETAVSNPRSTLGMSGVAARAGVSSVLGSLWSVNDQQIVTLINGFYRYWIQDGLSQPEALRQAQLDLIKNFNSHPSNWSSMILIQG